MPTTSAARPATLWWVLFLGVVSGGLYLAVQGLQREWDAALRVYPRQLEGPVVPYVLVTGALFVAYGGILRLCSQGRLATAGVRVLALGFPVVFKLMFLLSPPTFSGDVLSYIAHGYIGAELNGNPYLQPDVAVVGTRVEGHLAAYRWQSGQPVSPYGPLFTTIQVAAVRASTDVGTLILTFKALALAAALGTAAMIWVVLGHLTPDLRLLGTLTFLWNPTIIVELAGEGHNDGLMGFFVVLAIAFAVRRTYGGTVLALTGGVLIKYLPLLFGPLLAFHWLRSGAARRWAEPAFLGAWGAAGLISLGLFLPWWAGTSTFDGIRITGRAGDTGSSATMALLTMSRLIGRPISTELLSFATLVTALAVVGLTAPSCGDDRGLVRGCARVSLVYVLLLSPNYWSWYVVVPIALLALDPRVFSIVLILALSVGSRLAAPLVLLSGTEHVGRAEFLLGTWILGSGIPLLIVAGWVGWWWLRRRIDVGSRNTQGLI